MHFDGSKMRLGLGAGILLSSPKGDRLKYTLEIHFAASNNVAEYEALVHGLWLAKELGIRRILCYGDSDLVVQQSFGEWDAHDSNMASYRFLIQKLSGFFAGCEILHVPCAENEAADTHAKIASSRQSVPSGVSLEHLHKPSVKLSPDSESIHIPADPAAPRPGPGTAPADPAAPQPGPGTAPANPATPQSEPEMVAVFAVATAPSWALPISEFLENRVLPMDETEARQVQRQGECGHHAASRSLVAKAFRHGFYWPTALEDAESLVLKCEGCQRFSKRSHQPASALRTIPISWPFAWIEARPIKKLDGPTAVQFIKDIAVRYGMPNSIITDNGTNFAKGALAQYCSVSGIRLDLASVAHPQSNDQVERANGLILSGIKPRLVEPLIRSPSSWLDELPAVLWSLLSMPNSKKIKPLAFREGDLVFRLVQEQTGQHKLSSPWEGPFIISKALCNRNAYYPIDACKRKRDTAGEETTRPWNAELLCPFYS
ncbi:uncharacterized protein [Aegilops tauschii subsp. strangulata]|uniref:uncharacterized protein n=1 Tax=Aegilops tauschii subsp. strangulata TaxID=200361 RepID=UPI001ABD1344|nr:uncharacterized protein LOC120968971 [Aegilops tauschii subsp. strangulata]